MVRETLTFDIGAGDTGVTVRSWQELIDWIERERSRWDWMVPGEHTDPNGWASTVRNQWHQIAEQAAGIHSQARPLEDVRSFLSPLAEGGGLLASESQDGRLILDIRSRAGDVPAAFAYAFIKQAARINDVNNREALLGAVLTVLPEFGEPSELASALKRERANTRSAAKSITTRLEDWEQERQEQSERYLRRASLIALRVLRRHRERWKRQQGNWQMSATQAVADLKGVENTYREAMRLQAPVEYWRTKASGHETKEKSARGRLQLFFPAMIASLAAAFWMGGDIILDNAPSTGEQAPVALYVVISGALAFLSTVVFWIGRLLTKLYLSEHHLRNDAEERAVMTETYLALTNESAAEDADRQIILNALFRNTVDGIVKEDGPSDLNLHAALSRFFAR